MTFVPFCGGAWTDISWLGASGSGGDIGDSMKPLRSLFPAGAILAFLCSATFAQDATLSPNLVRVMVQAKNVYVVTGHVRYYKTKAIVKRELVEVTPFEEPTHKELEKWGRFTIVPDFKKADLYIRVYEKAGAAAAPVTTSGATSSGDAGNSYIILDVVQPSSKKILWSTSKNVARTWNNNTAVAGLMKHLREYLEAQEKTVKGPSVIPTSDSSNRPQVVEQPQAIQQPQ